MNKVLLVYQSGNDRIVSNAKVIAMMINCDVYCIGCDAQIDFDVYSDIIIGFDDANLTLPDSVREFVASIDWTGRRIFLFVISGGMCGDGILRLKEMTAGAKLEYILIVRYGKYTRLTGDETIELWVNDVRKSVGMPPLRSYSG